jgi:hypothetical protein
LKEHCNGKTKPNLHHNGKTKPNLWHSNNAQAIPPCQNYGKG